MTFMDDLDDLHANQEAKNSVTHTIVTNTSMQSLCWVALMHEASSLM